jgi:hypothetical protein
MVCLILVKIFFHPKISVMKEITFYEIKQLMIDTLQSIRHELAKCQRPADEIILNDEDVMKMLKISKRKLQYMRSVRLIPYYRPDGQVQTYYLLSDILDWLEKAKTDSIANSLRI